MQRIIAKDGKGYYHIVTNHQPHGAEMYAASTLYQYLYKATGAIIPYFSDIERCPRRTPEIHIGPFVRGINTEVNHLSDDGFVIKTRGEDIVIAGKTPRGTIYGVYFFLEKYINFKCFTKDIETFDKNETLIVEDIDICENPAFEYREVYFRSAFDPDFCVKNRLNSNIAHIPNEKGGKMKFYNFHHSFSDLVPPEKYYDEHPEYFSLVDGKRVREKPQLCLTNEGTFQVARKTLRKWIKENPECRVFSISQNDWSNYCTCPDCRKLDEQYSTPAASLITFVNKLAEDIEEDYPNVLLHTFAYQYSTKAPIGLKVAKNVIVRLCNGINWSSPIIEQTAIPNSRAEEFIENMRNWGAICDRLYIWDYACNFRHYLLPFPNYRTMPENLRTYRENNVVGMLQQGNFAYGETSALADLESYLAARLLWNPNQSEEQIIDDFISGVYGESCYPYIKKYVNLLSSTVKGHRLGMYDDPDASYFTDTLVDEAEELFKSALQVAKTEKICWYLEKEYLSVRYMRISRMPLDDTRRNSLIDELYKDVKRFQITEIRERDNLEITFDNLRNYRYAASNDNQYQLYYIMK